MRAKIADRGIEKLDLACRGFMPVDADPRVDRRDSTHFLTSHGKTALEGVSTRRTG
jgi:hypothetical protein